MGLEDLKKQAEGHRRPRKPSARERRRPSRLPGQGDRVVSDLKDSSRSDLAGPGRCGLSLHAALCPIPTPRNPN